MSRQKFKYLKNEKNFQDEIKKTFFIIFKVILMKQIKFFLEGESPTLIITSSSDFLHLTSSSDFIFIFLCIITINCQEYMPPLLTSKKQLKMKTAFKHLNSVI